MNLAEFRAIYPQYDGVDDATLSRRLYEKFYADKVDYYEFARRFEAPMPEIPAMPGAESPVLPTGRPELMHQPPPAVGSPLMFDPGPAAPAAPDMGAIAMPGEAASVGDYLARNWQREQQINSTVHNVPLERVLADLERSGRGEVSAFPANEPTALRQAADALFGNPDGQDQAGAVMAKAAMDRNQSVQHMADQVGPPVGILERGARDFAAGALGTVQGITGYGARLADSAALLSAADKLGAVNRDLLPEDPGFADKLAAGFGSTATFFIPGVGVMRGAKAAQGLASTLAGTLGAGTATALEAAAEAGQVYETLRAKGMSHADASRRADLTLAANAALLQLTNKLGLFGEGGERLTQVFRAAGMEGAQEAGQSAIGNVATDEPVTEGMAESAAIGALVGGGMRTLTSEAGPKEQRRNLGQQWAEGIDEAQTDGDAIRQLVADLLAPQQPEGRPGESVPVRFAPRQAEATAGTPQPQADATSVTFGDLMARAAAPEAAPVAEEPTPPRPAPREPDTRMEKAMRRKAATRKARVVRPETDELLVAIAKHGGLAIEDAEAIGIDPAEWRGNRKRKHWGMFSAFTPNGMRLDDLIEALHMDGFTQFRPGLHNYDQSVLADAILEAANGRPVYAPAYHERQQEQFEREDEDMALADVKREAKQQGLRGGAYNKFVRERMEAWRAENQAPPPAPATQPDDDLPGFEEPDYAEIWFGDGRAPALDDALDEPAWLTEGGSSPLPLEALDEPGGDADGAAFVTLAETARRKGLSEDTIEELLERAAIAEWTVEELAESLNEAIEAQGAAGATAGDQPAAGEGAPGDLGAATVPAEPGPGPGADRGPDARGSGEGAGLTLTGGQAPATAAPRPAGQQQGDIFGTNPTQQALADRERARQRAIDTAPDMDQGEGNLFSDADRQADIADVARRPAPAVSPAPTPEHEESYSGRYSDGGAWEATYRAVRRSDGSYAIERTIKDDDGETLSHLRDSGEWARGGAARTAVTMGRGVQEAGASIETFASVEAARAAMQDDARSMGGERSADAAGRPEQPGEEPAPEASPAAGKVPEKISDSARSTIRSYKAEEAAIRFYHEHGGMSRDDYEQRMAGHEGSAVGQRYARLRQRAEAEGYDWDAMVEQVRQSYPDRDEQWRTGSMRTVAEKAAEKRAEARDRAGDPPTGEYDGIQIGRSYQEYSANTQANEWLRERFDPPGQMDGTGEYGVGTVGDDVVFRLNDGRHYRTDGPHQAPAGAYHIRLRLVPEADVVPHSTAAPDGSSARGASHLDAVGRRTAMPPPAPDQPPQAFEPTHELADGTRVIAGDQPGVWLDEDGTEIEDDSAQPIEEQAPEPPAPRRAEPEAAETELEALGYSNPHSNEWTRSYEGQDAGGRRVVARATIRVTDNGYALRGSVTFPGSGLTGPPSVELGRFKTAAEADKVATDWMAERADEDGAPAPAATAEEIRTADRLADQAEKLKDKAEAALGADRNTNTARRASMAASAEANARAELQIAETLANIAEAIRNGTAGPLASMRNRSQLEELLKQRRRAADRAKREGDSKDPGIEEIAAAVRMPTIDVHRSHLAALAKAIKGRRGSKDVREDLERAAESRRSEWIGTITSETAAAVQKLAKGIKDTDYALKMVRDAAREVSRLEAMGVTNEYTLAAALRQLEQHRAGRRQADPAKELERQLVGTKIPGFFPTPPAVAERLVEAAELEAGQTVLEPSAGSGNLIDAIKTAEPGAEVRGIERNGTLHELLRAKGHDVELGDFLEHRGEYHRIVMNPPFEGGQDGDHVRHAYELLKPGGRLVAVMGEGTFSRSDRKATEFREWLEDVGGTDEKLPAGSFEDRSQVRTTGTATRMVVIEKPTETAAARRASDRPEAGATLDSRSPAARAVTEAIEGIDTGAELDAAGQAYVGFVEQLPVPPSALVPAARSQRQSPQPLRREEILERYLKALNITLYQGRVKGKGRMGWFRVGNKAIRIKRKNDLEVAAHEIAHYLDYEHRDLSLVYKANPVFQDELRGVSYDVKKDHEGFAEWMRLWMTQPAEAAQRAPTWTAWFENWLETEAPANVRKAVTGARDDMRAWYAQDAVARLESKVGGQELTQHLTTALQRFRQSVTDDLMGVLAMEQALTGESVPRPMGIYENARLSRAAYTIVDHALHQGAPVAEFRQVNGERVLWEVTTDGPGLKQILGELNDGDLDDWIAYAVAKSASELMGQGRENLFTREEITAGLALNRNRPKGPDGRTDFDRVFDEYQAFNRRIVDFAVQMGVIDPKSRARWQRQWYIPFYRVSQPSMSQRRGGIEGDVQVTRRLTGGTGNLRDILGNMVQNASQMITAGLRNEARQRIVRLADQTPGGGQWLSKIPRETKAQDVDTEQLRIRMYEAMGLPKRAATNQTVREQLDEEQARIADAIDQWAEAEGPMAQFWMFAQPPTVRGGDQVMAVLNNGRADYYEVADPTLWRSLNRLQRPQIEGLRRAMSLVRRFSQASITLSVDFMTANIWRDTLHGWVFSRGRFRPMIDSARGMAHRIKSDTLYQQWRANGGDMASYLTEEDALRKDLERFYTRRGINVAFLMDTPARLFRGLETMSSAFEAATRLGEFQRAMEGGQSPRRAAYLSREVSADYAMRGDSAVLGWIYDTALFFKAGVNGLDRALRGFASTEERRTVAMKAAAIATASMALATLNRSNPCYQNLPDWDKDGHWHFFIPTGGGGATGDCAEDYVHLRMPKIWEIGAIASMAERAWLSAVDGLYEGKDVDKGKLFRQLFHIFITQFKLDPEPAVTAPLTEVYITNRNAFTGGDVIPPSLETLPPSMQSTAYTSATWRAAGEASARQPGWARDTAEFLTGDRSAFEVSPKRLEHLYRGYTNTMGLYAQMLVDWAVFGEEKPETPWTRMPVARRFTGTHPGRVQASDDFYEFYRQAEQVSRAVRAGAKRMRPELAELYARDPRAAEWKLASATMSRIRAMNNAQALIYADPTLTPAEKREQLDELTRAKNAVFIGTMDAVRQQRAEREARDRAAE